MYIKNPTIEYRRGKLRRQLVNNTHFQSQFGPAYRAFEAAAVEEGEVLQRTHPVHLVHDFAAPEARALVEVGPVHVRFSAKS